MFSRSSPIPRSDASNTPIELRQATYVVALRQPLSCSKKLLGFLSFSGESQREAVVQKFVGARTLLVDILSKNLLGFLNKALVYI